MAWRRQRVALPFRIGPVSLAVWPLDAAVNEAHAAQLARGAAEEFPAAAMRAAGTRVAVISSCPVDRLLPRLRATREGLRYVPGHHMRHFTAASGDFARFLRQHLPSRTRAELKRKVRRLVEQSGGTTPLAEYRRPEELAEWHRLTGQVLRAARPEQMAGPGDLARCRDQAAQGHFRGYLLFGGQDRRQPLAFCHCSVLPEGVLVHEDAAHDPAHAALWPAAVLLYLVLERVFADPQVQIVDLTAAAAEQRQRFAAEGQRCADVMFFAWRPEHLVAVLLHALLEQLVAGARAGLARLRLPGPLRRVLSATG
jgi:hypothetical protein